jgi:hypothetical protein
MVDLPGRARHHLWLFASGATIGGTTTGLVIALIVAIGSVPRIPRYTSILVVLILALVGLLRDAQYIRIPLPQAKRQVPPTILVDPARFAAFKFGLELGTGVRTYVTASAPYVAVVMAVLLQIEVADAVTMGVCFGLARGFVVFERAYSKDPFAWDERLRSLKFTFARTSLIAAAILTLSVAV